MDISSGGSWNLIWRFIIIQFLKLFLLLRFLFDVEFLLISTIIFKFVSIVWKGLTVHFSQPSASPLTLCIDLLQNLIMCQFISRSVHSWFVLICVSIHFSYLLFNHFFKDFWLLLSFIIKQRLLCCFNLLKIFAVKTVESVSLSQVIFQFIQILFVF